MTQVFWAHSVAVSAESGAGGHPGEAERVWAVDNALPNGFQQFRGNATCKSPSRNQHTNGPRYKWYLWGFQWFEGNYNLISGGFMSILYLKGNALYIINEKGDLEHFKASVLSCLKECLSCPSSTWICSLTLCSKLPVWILSASFITGKNVFEGMLMLSTGML